MLLLQETERALADTSTPKVIFLHMMGSHPNPCDRLHSWQNNYLEQYSRKIACYLASISKLDNFLGQLDGILRRHSRHFAMLGFAPIFPDICYHLTHYKPAAADIPVASDNPAHYADAIRYNARTPLQGSLLPLTRLVWA